MVAGSRDYPFSDDDMNELSVFIARHINDMQSSFSVQSDVIHALIYDWQDEQIGLHGEDQRFIDPNSKLPTVAPCDHPHWTATRGKYLMFQCDKCFIEGCLVTHIDQGSISVEPHDFDGEMCTRCGTRDPDRIKPTGTPALKSPAKFPV